MYIGVDIEDISRFKDKTLEKDFSFLSKIFTRKELEYCFSKANPAQHLAVRLCAKEAVIKALTQAIENTIVFSDIEVMNMENGAPYVSFLNKDIDFDVKISLSHEKDKAIAFAVVV